MRSPTMHSLSSRLSILAMLMMVGCASAQNVGMESGWNYDSGKSALQYLPELERTTAPSAAEKVTVAIGVTKDGLTGRVLPDGALWKRKASPNALPSLNGSVVAYSEENEITALVAATGQFLWSIPSAGRMLEGLADNGEVTALLLVDRHDARPDVVVVLDRTGHERFRRSTSELMGTPAITRGMVLVPWGRQYVSAYEPMEGKPLGRLLLRDSLGAISATHRGVYALGRGVTRLTTKVASLPDSKSLQLPALELPGEPRWPVDGTMPRKLGQRSVALLASPSASGEAFEEDTAVAIYYSILTGLHASSGNLKWVNWLPKTVIGSQAGEHGIAACAEDGSVTGIGLKDGHLEPLGSLETRLSACVVSAPGAPIAGKREEPLELQVKAAIENTHSDMEAAKIFLVRQVRASSRPEITALLLALAKDPLRSSELRTEATAALETRTDSAELFLKEIDSALKHAQGEDVPAIKLSVLARAALRQDLKASAPLLAEFLRLPLVSDEEAASIFEVLKRFGGPTEVPAVMVFFHNFRTTGGNAELINALSIAYQFSKRFGDDEAKTTIEAELNEPSTHPLVRDAVAEAIKKAERKKQKTAPPPQP